MILDENYGEHEHTWYNILVLYMFRLYGHFLSTRPAIEHQIRLFSVFNSVYCIVILKSLHTYFTGIYIIFSLFIQIIFFNVHTVCIVALICRCNACSYWSRTLQMFMSRNIIIQITNHGFHFFLRCMNYGVEASNDLE